MPRLYTVIAFLFGVALTTVFHPLDLPLLLPLSLSGLLYLLERSRNKKQAFMVGFAFGLGHFTTSLYWIAYSLSFEPEKFWWLTPFAMLGIPAVLACFMGLIALMLVIIAPTWGSKRNSLKSVIKAKDRVWVVVVFASCWTMLEFFRSYVFNFPWNLLGYASNFSLAFMQVASVIGVYGLSLVLALTGGIFYTRNFTAILCGLVICGLIFGWGYRRLEQPEEKQVKKIIVRLVQPNITELYLGDEQKSNKALEVLSTLTQAPGLEKVDVVIWPESALPFAVSSSSSTLNYLAKMAPKNGFLVAGGDRYEKDMNGQLKAFNSLFVINAQGQVVAFYDKTILVPFGEYIPFHKWLPFVDKVTQGTVDFSHNLHYHPIELPGIGKVLPLICYEAAFASLFFNDVGGNITFLLNITNDLWFKDSIGPYQHFAMAKMRAIEQGKSLVRVANTGISAVIDAKGRILAYKDLYTRGSIDIAIELPSHDGETLYEKIKLLVLLNIALIFTASIISRVYKFLRYKI